MDGHSVQRVFVRGLLLFALVLLSCSSEDEDDKRRTCERYRDRIVELRLADAPNAKVAAEHRDLLKESLGDEFISSCESSMTIDELHCAMAADDSSAALACSTAAQ